ncbi:DUF397 domain-containing protein [Streptomyces griseofuscus]|uniref:DUF397 domain-containing protein n=1 Tax=Streptomyces griseofuscus TaxID=146922 RepID=UPI00367A8824
MTTIPPRWFTSSYSGNGGQCIEVATNLVASRNLVPIRDTKDHDAGEIAVSPRAWSAFTKFASGQNV